MRHGSLFSGIGGFDLAAQWMGWENVFQVEIDPFCQKVLAKNFPNVKRYGDIKQFDGTEWAGKIDILTGGFPCQDISISKNKAIGIKGQRSGLWNDYSRVISKINPKIIIGENTTQLLRRGFEKVLCDFSEMGYYAEWGCFQAYQVGAPHIRERLFFIAHSFGDRWGNDLSKEIKYNFGRSLKAWPNIQAFVLANTEESQYAGDPENIRIGDGVPDWVDRIKGLGNAIVPQVAYEIFKAIEKVHSTNVP